MNDDERTLLKNNAVDTNDSAVDLADSFELNNSNSQIGREKNEGGSLGKRKKRNFDMKKYSKRRIALMIAYCGWDYNGMVDDDKNKLPHVHTIEGELAKALLKTKLIESIDKCELSRCGRTDAGVSGEGQVVSLVVRSQSASGTGVFLPDGHQLKSNDMPEIEYSGMLNHVLPPEIRVFSWAPVDEKFNTRHSCTKRVYKYTFLNGGLDIDKMREACALLIGEHDFRNFCKINEHKINSSHIRRIFDVRIEKTQLYPFNAPTHIDDIPYQMYELTIEATGFLWHMVRCIVSVLAMVGRGNEKPQIITDLFDFRRYPGRPCFAMAAALPLSLYECHFDNNKLDWHCNDEAAMKTANTLQKKYAEYMVKAHTIRRMIDRLDKLTSGVTKHVKSQNFVMDGHSNRFVALKHKPLEQRQLGESLEEKRIKQQRQIGDGTIERERHVSLTSIESAEYSLDTKKMRIH